LKNFKTSEFQSIERRYLSYIFFLFGLSIMSLAPRTPDLKANLAVNNGTFGTLLSTASIGSIVMLLIGGQIVHRIGSKKSMQIGVSVIALTFIVLAHTSSPFVFTIANILGGSAISIFHIASSGHTLHRQDQVGKVIIPKLHGAWGIGAMTSSAIAFLVAANVSIAWHISTLMLIVWVLTIYVINALSPSYPPKPEGDDAYRLTSLKQFKFKVNWFLSIGFFCASIVEFTIADWGTLFGKEVMGMAQSTSALNYLIYLLGLIIGRFSIGWALKHGSEQFWIKSAGVFGGGGFILFLLLSTALLETNKTLAYTLNFLGFLIAGLGTSFLAPIFFSIAGRLAGGKNSLAVAQLSFVNTLLIFNSKFILAWIVQITSITVALIAAGALMLLLFHFGKVGSKKRI
jgi:MFS family permease